MKVFLLTGLLAGSIGLNVYLLNSPVIVEGSLDGGIVEPLDEIKLAQSAVEKNTEQNQYNFSHDKQLTKIQKKFLPEKT